MDNYLFEIMSGEWEGEEFFVQATTEDDALYVAQRITKGEDFQCLGVYSNEEAECMGYDTY